MAEEVLGALRTVVAFGGQDYEIRRYGKKLDGARKYGLYRGLTIGGSIFFLFAILYSVESVAFGLSQIFSTICVCDFGDSLTVIFCVVIAVFIFGQGANNLNVIQVSSQFSVLSYE